MAYTFVKSCYVCKLIRKQGGENKSDLLRRIFHSTQFNESGESLMTIFRDYGGETDKQQFGYLSLYNHAKKHQTMDKAALAEHRIAKLTEEIEVEKIRASFTHQDVRGMIRDLGGKQILEGNMKVSGAVLATILKQEADIEEKAKDRELEVLKMVRAFQSGALLQEDEDGPVTAYLPSKQ